MHKNRYNYHYPVRPKEKQSGPRSRKEEKKLRNEERVLF